MKMKLTSSDRIFKDALLRGTGRCFAMLATESERRKYRPLVMWACGRDLGYDTQIEGTRALFLYDLIGQYPSPEPFLDIAEKSFFASFNKGNWLFQQECELLALFAKTGKERARRILERGYMRFHQYLSRLNPAKISNPYIPALDNFNSLCEQLLFCAKSVEAQPILERIVRDVGGLCMRDSFWNATAESVQLSFGIVLGDRRLATMLGRISSIPEVEAYKAALLQAKKKSEANDVERERRLSLGYKEVYRRIKEQDISGVRGIVGAWRSKGRMKDIEGLVKLYEKEEAPSTRAAILDMFRAPKHRGYLPLDSVLQDASSEDDELRDSAFYVLDGIKDRRVRDFAFGVLKKHGMSYEIASLIARNYRETDDDLLITASKKLGEMRRHYLGLGVLYNVGGKGGGLSKRILIYLYDTTRCSYCRERAVRELGRRGFLTDDMLAECLHDASGDIRDYAKRLLSRRRVKTISNLVNPDQQQNRKEL